MRTTTTLALASVLGATLLLGGPVRAGEDSARERVQELLPRLQSEDDAVREQAEKELFRLGEDGRREMERLSRDTDTRRALTALRLLQSDRWADSTLRDGEQRLRRSGDDGPRLDDLEKEMEARFAEIQKRLEEALKDVPRLRVPDWPRLDLSPDDSVGSITMAGSVTRGERRITWQRAADGKVRVTVRDGDGEERVHEADDIEAFREAYPEVAAELDEIVPTWTGAPTVRLFEHLPEVRIPPDVWRWWHDEDGAERTPSTGSAEPRGPMLGIQWGPVSPLLRHHLRLGDRGVVVESVLPDTLAARLGMKPMDVLVELAGRPVHGRADIGAALRAAGDTRVEAVVIRRGERRTLRQPE